MKTSSTHPTQTHRAGERGAALITVLLLSTLLLTAGGALILTTSMSASSAVDTESEEQAYAAAEAGLQDALNVLRGNFAPNECIVCPLDTSSPQDGNKISFRKAVTRSVTNKSTDPSKYTGTNADFPLRLSRWLNYNYTPPGSNAPDRVTLTPNYTPFSGMAYSVEVIDPLHPTPADITNFLAAPANSAYEPDRLIIQATGYGPKGARKQLRMVISKLFFNVSSPSPIVIRGSDDGSTMPVFDLGSSNSKNYSGDDFSAPPSVPNKPAVSISLHDWTKVNTGMVKGSTIDNPKIGILDLDVVPNVPPVSASPIWPSTLTPIPTAGTKPPSSPTPYFLQTADAARAFVDEARELAKAMGRYYTGATFTSQLGGIAGAGPSNTDPAFTFVEGNCTLNGGSGLILTTGELTIDGNDDFQGIVLVLGGGKVIRSGGGNGNILGTWIVAKFNSTGGFLAPYWDTSGGGNGKFIFDSDWINKGNTQAGRRSLGIVER